MKTSSMQEASTKTNRLWAQTIYFVTRVPKGPFFYGNYDMAAPKLELFKYDTCPFCVRVMMVVDKLNLKVEMKDILMDQSNLQRLMSDTGRRTVPCLYIDNQPMFESADIMQWLTENSDKLEKNS